MTHPRGKPAVSDRFVDWRAHTAARRHGERDPGGCRTRPACPGGRARAMLPPRGCPIAGHRSCVQKHAPRRRTLAAAILAPGRGGRRATAAARRTPQPPCAPLLVGRRDLGSPSAWRSHKGSATATARRARSHDAAYGPRARPALAGPWYTPKGVRAISSQMSRSPPSSGWPISIPWAYGRAQCERRAGHDRDGHAHGGDAGGHDARDDERVGRTNGLGLMPSISHLSGVLAARDTTSACRRSRASSWKPWSFSVPRRGVGETRDGQRGQRVSGQHRHGERGPPGAIRRDQRPRSA